MRASKILVLWLFALLCIAATVFAAPVSPLSVSVLSSGSRQFSNVSDGTVSAQGGNVTAVNLDVLSVTKVWQGYYGNLTGNIHLDDANNNSFYIWGNGTLSGEVFASRTSSPDWSTINCTNATQRLDEEAYLGISSTDGDSVVNTFNYTNHPSFYVGVRPVNANSCYSTNVLVNETAQNSTFYQMLLSDNSSNLVYTTIIEDDEYGFTGELVDFQLLVGENEHVDSIGPTSYYFFVELS